MAGDVIYEGRGKVSISRVLDGGDGLTSPKIELSFSGVGKFLYNNEVEVIEFWTLVATVRPDNSALGNGQGIMFTKDRAGREIVTATCNGIGTTDYETGNTKNALVNVYTVKNLSSRSTLGFLHNKVGIAEYSIDDEKMEYEVKVREYA